MGPQVRVSPATLRWGSLWFTGCTLFYLLFRGFYHIGIQKDRNNVAYKIALTQKGSRGVGAQPPLFNKQNVKF